MANIRPISQADLHRGVFRNFYVCQGTRTSDAVHRVENAAPCARFPVKMLFVDGRVLPLHRASGNNVVTRSELWRVPNKCKRIYVILPVVIPSLLFRLSSSFFHLYISLRLSLFLFRPSLFRLRSRVRVTLIAPLFVAPFSDRSRFSREEDESFSSERAHHCSLVFLVRRESIWRGAASVSSPSRRRRRRCRRLPDRCRGRSLVALLGISFSRANRRIPAFP